MFPTITATVTLESYERKVTSPVLFLIPRDYKKVSILNVTRASLSECSSELTSTTNKAPHGHQLYFDKEYCYRMPLYYFEPILEFVFVQFVPKRSDDHLGSNGSIHRTEQ